MKRREFLKNTARGLLLGGLVAGVAGSGFRNSGVREDDEACRLKCRNCPAWKVCRRLKSKTRTLKPETLQETVE